MECMYAFKYSELLVENTVYLSKPLKKLLLHLYVPVIIFIMPLLFETEIYVHVVI